MTDVWGIFEGWGVRCWTWGVEQFVCKSMNLVPFFACFAIPGTYVSLDSAHILFINLHTSIYLEDMHLYP